MATNDSAVAERASQVRDDVSDTVEQASEAARDRAAELRVQARKGGAQAREAAEELAESLEPARRRAEHGAGSALRVLAKVLALVPGVLAELFGGLSRAAATLAGDADHLAERGREAAYRLEPPARVRRRNRRRMATWFTGGLVIGAAAGWVAHDRLAGDAVDAGPDGDGATSRPAPGAGARSGEASLN